MIEIYLSGRKGRMSGLQAMAVSRLTVLALLPRVAAAFISPRRRATDTTFLVMVPGLCSPSRCRHPGYIHQLCFERSLCNT